MFGSVLGRLGFDVIEDRLKDEAATFVKDQPEPVLEFQSGSGGDGLTEKAAGEGIELLAERKTGLPRPCEDRLKVLNDNRSRDDGQNDRLHQGGRLSRGRTGPCGPGGLATFFLAKSASCFQFLKSRNRPHPTKPLKSPCFSLFSRE